ncbi:hypothetical protein C5Y96_15790 [Blastopirellula marina]|uniref:DUF11 domain-containing protein n=1 Tax=Blastopirellula marina TaxID=124 RepID=A0A2S8FAL1_9BACT|nr:MULTISPECIES: DUF11 domain-containing protein [Pirellulaceae]PQO29208.1 hypothetical protein C5Y96_15790 [Blastopirellula marina]RCS50401.1 hypothetical protein DTL36_15810 [Bremerella cremea]
MKNNFAFRQLVTLTLLVACGSVFPACSLNRQAKQQEEAPVKPDAGVTFNQPHVPEYNYASAPSPAPVQSAENTGLNGVPEFQSRYQGQPYQAPANTATTPQYNYPGAIQRTSAEMPIEQQPAAAPTATQQVSYAFPRGQVMPPCGPGCQHPNSICQHGATFGSCQTCRACGLPFQAGPCWPEDEYLYDGGDRNIRAEIDGEFGVHGLDIEDTIGHYDTLDGQRVVTPSNRVCIYAPRFAAVRKVAGLNQEVLGRQIAGIDADLQLINQQQNGTPVGMVQPLALRGNIGGKNANALTEDLPPLMAHNWQKPHQFIEEFKAYENLSLIRYGILEQGEKPRLSQSLQNAVTWTRNQQVQVVLEGRKASEVVDGDTPHEFVWSEVPGEPRLRVIKVADKGAAEIGEIVEFTLRFDNVGTQIMGNVTIIDNLTPRLEYVEGSAQCNIDAQFLKQANEAGSEVLRWEIKDPLAVQAGGIIRFKCRVR